jgi:hypothetical protein
MDVQQLKLLAGRIRDLLERANVTVTHNQALDLSGALVGLRNWPEVQAFPTRIAAADLDLAAAGRLAHRLHRKHSRRGSFWSRCNRRGCKHQRSFHKSGRQGRG